ncbi:DUF3027 domain-containing protein [Microbacterium sp. A1-JK]|uniref:DUF3027 domain-containing protein n=1 Tax=Microbacterium sp. A1-JK TaxID=3177516 RepID=UPI0038899532
MTSKSEPADAELLAAHDLAIAALAEVTPVSSIGAPAGYTLEDDGVVSLRFATTLPGYPGWFWTVSLARVEGEAPTVLEVELLPGDGALLAPDWVPWAERLADYQAAQTALAEASESDDDDDDDSDDDFEDDDEEDDDDDDEGVSRTHGGDIDGVEIDELDDATAEDDDSDGEDSDEDEEYFDRSEPASDER